MITPSKEIFFLLFVPICGIKEVTKEDHKPNNVMLKYGLFHSLESWRKYDKISLL